MKIFNFIKNINSQLKVSNETSQSFKEANNNMPSLNQPAMPTQTLGKFELMSLSAQERMNLIKELLSFPNDTKGLENLLKTLAKNNKLDITVLKELISANAKEGMNKLIKLNNINMQNGNIQTKETQEIINLLASISISTKTNPEALKEIINIYVPIQNPKEFDVQIEPKSTNENKGNPEGFISFLIESKTLGGFYTELFKDENNIACIIKSNKENQNIITNIKNTLDKNAQISFIETNQTQEEYQDKVIFFQNNIADLDILNFMFNLIREIHLQSSRKSLNL